MNKLGRVGFIVLFDGIRVYITLKEYFMNKIIGLCGTYNLNSDDDFLAPNNMVETNIVTFSDYFKVNKDLETPMQTSPCDQMISVIKFKSFFENKFK